MIYATILDDGEKYYTHMRKIFDALGNAQTKYNWLITDCECCSTSSDIVELLSGEYCWISGEKLTSIVNQEDFQWIWAVLSGFEKNISIDQVLQHPLPYANEYTGFWDNPISMQHPLATIEIVTCDSTLTLFFSKNKKIMDSYKKAFPLCKDLELYNKEFAICERKK